MCPPPCGPRRARLGRPRKRKEFPTSWLNDKRVATEEAVYSANGKTLVRINPNLTGEFVVPATVTRVLSSAFEKASVSSVVFHLGVTSTIVAGMFWNANKSITITMPSGEMAIFYAGRNRLAPIE